jgi:uncharacterized protein (TIGR00251 family)
MAGATLSVKVVPGASVDRVVGRYGEAVKVQVTAPPEGGKANEAVLELLATALSVRPSQLTLVRGHGHSRKVIHVQGIDLATAQTRLFGTRE